MARRTRPALKTILRLKPVADPKAVHTLEVPNIGPCSPLSSEDDGTQRARRAVVVEAAAALECANRVDPLHRAEVRPPVSRAPIRKFMACRASPGAMRVSLRGSHGRERRATIAISASSALAAAHTAFSSESPHQPMRTEAMETEVGYKDVDRISRSSDTASSALLPTAARYALRCRSSKDAM